MKFIPTKLAGLASGVVTISCMVLLMPAISIYQQTGAIPEFGHVWLNTVISLAPVMMPIGLLIGFTVNLAIRSVTKASD